jgi:hypothetical protein
VPATSLARTVIDLIARLDFPDAVAMTEAVLRGQPDSLMSSRPNAVDGCHGAALNTGCGVGLRRLPE